jgi:streptogramin lyase
MRRLAILAVMVLLPTSAEARSQKGEWPTSLGVGYGAVWVGAGSGVVTRVDVRTGLRTVRDHETLTITSLATGFGSVWAAPNGTPLYRLDPRSGRMQQKLWNQPGGWSPTFVGTGMGSVWVGDYGRNAIFRVDPHTNRITRRKGLPHRLRSLAVGESGVWLQSIPRRGPAVGPRGSRIVSRLDPTTMKVHRAFRLTCDASLLTDGPDLWALDNCTGVLRRFNARQGEFDRSVKTAPGSLGLMRGFGSLWVSNGATVRRIDPVRRVVVASIRSEGPFIAAGEGFVWVLDWGDGGWLRRIDPSTNQLVGKPIRLDRRR